MAKFNKSVAPYYDDYDSNKQYTHLLAVPGRVAQARELTQVQSVVKDIVKNIGDELYRDKILADGCSVSINVKEHGERYALVEPGKVYLDGMVLPVGRFDTESKEYLPIEIGPLSTLPTEEQLSQGVEVKDIIGVILEEILITEKDDPSLLDPAQGFDNHTQAGCHRIKSTVKVVLNNSEASPIAEIINGVVINKDAAPDYGGINEVLAQRTREESGSYVVEGLKVRASSETSDSYYRLKVDRGIAYVDGYRREIPSLDKYVSLPVSDSDYFNQEPRQGKTYTAGSDVILYEKGPYVKEITSLEAVIDDIVSMPKPSSNTATQTIPRNQLNGATEIYLQGGFIPTIYQGSKYFTLGVDYEITTSWSITWKGTDNFPTDTYNIELFYLSNSFTSGVDYTLAINDNNQSVLRWIGGVTPKDSSNIYLSWNVWKARKDTVYIDSEGTIGVELGTPSEIGTEGLPVIPSNSIALANIYIEPRNSIEGDTTSIAISNVSLTRFTMSDIQQLLKRIRSLEYNQANISLQEDTKSRSVSGVRNSIFADPLIDFSKIAYGYNLNPAGEKVNESLPTYRAAVDFESNICYLPIVSDLADLIYDTEKSTSSKYDRLLTLPKRGSETILSQNKATTTFLVNPYQQFPLTPEVSLTPSVDNWIDLAYIDVTKYQSAEEVVSMSTEYVEINDRRGSRRPSTSTSTVTDTAIGTRVETGTTTESVLYEEAIPYIRNQTPISVVGSQFPSGLADIECYFDGVRARIEPEGDTTSGSDVGYTVNAKSDGSFSAKFYIPANIPTGIKEVIFKTKIPGYGSEGEAHALYQANGTLKTIERTANVINKVLLRRLTTVTTTNYIDPVGQTFVLSDSVMLSAVELYFSTIPADNIPVTCDIREVVNGSITANILGHKTIYPNKPDSNNYIKKSEDSRESSRFTFDDPVYLEANKEYAFVVRTISNQYRLWVAELGQEEYVTKQSVLTNPYLVGVMMSSSNNSTWTAHQNMDIKFNLIADTYDKSADIYFNEIEANEFSRAYLVADSITPSGTSINWYYNLPNDSQDYSISPYDIKLFESFNNKITLKAHIEKNDTTSKYVTPIIATDTHTLMTSKYRSRGEYISVSFPGNGNNAADIIIDTYLGSGDIKVYYSIDEGITKVEATRDANASSPLNYGWEETVYKVFLGEDVKASSCKLFVELVGSDEESTEFVVGTPAISKIRVINYTKINDSEG